MSKRRGRKGVKNKPKKCFLCNKGKAKSKHHLIPRFVNDRREFLDLDFESLYKTVKLCDDCHQAIHEIYSHTELATKCPTPYDLMVDRKVVDIIIRKMEV